MDKFTVYKHQFELPNGTTVRRQLIAIKHDDGTLTFTNFGNFIGSSKAYTTPADDGNNQFYFVINMLNYTFEKYNLRKLDDLTIDMVRDYLQNYSVDSKNPRTKGTVIACTNAILKFLINYVRDDRYKSSIKEKDLYKKELYKDKFNNIQEKTVPAFKIICTNSGKTLLRDIPNKAFFLLINHIATEHTEFLGLVSLSAFSGLRPSEACNVRRENSALGPGILMTKTDGDITKIEIDLRKEIPLRSDNVEIGYIKKERMQVVPVLFVDIFVKFYNQYLKYLENKPYEEDFGPLSLNKQGKAISYRCYYNAFKQIVRNEMVPIFLASEDKELISYGRSLLEYDLPPHALRHWYSVQLTLAGYTIPELMHARGDKSPTSALTYIQNKGELEKQYTNVTNKLFDYLTWAAGEKHGI